MSGKMGPMQGVGRNETLTTLVGWEGGEPDGAVHADMGLDRSGQAFVSVQAIIVKVSHFHVLVQYISSLS
jgi:hypothetical protein